MLEFDSYFSSTKQGFVLFCFFDKRIRCLFLSQIYTFNHASSSDTGRVFQVYCEEVNILDFVYVIKPLSRIHPLIISHDKTQMAAAVTDHSKLE